MTLAVSAAFAQEIQQESPELVHLALIHVGVRVYFEIEDYANGAGDTLTVTLDAVASVITEGVDFDAATSDEQTALNIVEALIDLDAGFNAWAIGTTITVIGPHSSTLTGATGDATAWSLTPDADDIGTHGFVAGARVLFGYSPSIATAKPVGAELDPVFRTLEEPSKRYVEFEDDGGLRRLVAHYGDLKGKIIELYVGTHDIAAASDFAPDGIYQISEILPGNGVITAICMDVGALLAEQKVIVEVVNRHLLEAIEIVLIAAGVPAALYDATTLDPTAYADMGHLVTSRHPYEQAAWDGVGLRPALTEPVRALDLVNDLLQLLDGSLLPNELGVYAFRRYDRTASATVLFEDVRDFEPRETWEGLFNHVSVRGPRAIYEDQQEIYSQRDRNSEQRHTSAGGAPYRKTLEIKSDWLNGIGFLATTITSAAGQVARVNYAPGHGMSGTRSDNAATPTQGTNTTASSARPVYLLIFNPATGDREYVRCETVTIPASTSGNVPDNSGARFFAEFTLAARGLFGTTAAAWSRNPAGPSGQSSVPLVWDVTAAVDVAGRKLEQLAHGMPIVEFKTSWRTYYTAQLGEIASISSPSAAIFLDNLQDGIGNAVWQIIRKEPRLDDAEIDWALALVRYADTDYGIVPTHDPPIVVLIPPPTFANTLSLELNGSSQYVDLGTISTLDGRAFAVVGGWFRSVGSLPSNGEMFGIASQIRVEVQGAEINVAVGAYSEITTDSPLSADTWHHVVAVYRGASGVTIYVDGVASTTTPTGTLPTTLATGGNGRFGATTAPDNYFPGRLDEWFARGGAPSAAQVATEIYGNGVPRHLQRLPSLTAPAHWWRFENTFGDEIGTAHGTPVGVPFFSSDHP